MLVALRKESVDRNSLSSLFILLGFFVALRKESVDRNIRGEMLEHAKKVALRKESVDRNVFAPGTDASAGQSLSARRAWIEID